MDNLQRIVIRLVAVPRDLGDLCYLILGMFPHLHLNLGLHRPSPEELVQKLHGDLCFLNLIQHQQRLHLIIDPCQQMTL